MTGTGDQTSSDGLALLLLLRISRPGWEDRWKRRVIEPVDAGWEILLVLGRRTATGE